MLLMNVRPHVIIVFKLWKRNFKPMEDLFDRHVTVQKDAVPQKQSALWYLFIAYEFIIFYALTKDRGEIELDSPN